MPRPAPKHADSDEDGDDDLPAGGDADSRPLLSPLDSPEAPARPPPMTEHALTLLYVLAYLVIGPALILVNKRILKDIGFHFPMMVSGIGQAASALGSAIVIHVLRLQPLQSSAQVTWPFYLKNMMVVGASTAASLCFGNAGYLYLTVSFVQILKAFTPVFVVAMLFVTAVETPTRRVSCSVFMICVGTAIASAGETNFSSVGLLIMFAAETCEATRLVLTQKLLTNLKFPAMEGLYYMAPICTFWMWGLAALFELPAAVREGSLALVQQNPLTFLSAVVLGFAVNVSSFLVIKRSSSIMLKLLGTARNAGLVLFSSVFLGETITRTQTFGYAVCLTFFGAYNYCKLHAL